MQGDSQQLRKQQRHETGETPSPEARELQVRDPQYLVGRGWGHVLKKPATATKRKKRVSSSCCLDL